MLVFGLSRFGEFGELTGLSCKPCERQGIMLMVVVVVAAGVAMSPLLNGWVQTQCSLDG